MTIAGIRAGKDEVLDRAIQFATIAILYVVGGRLGLLLAVPPGYATAIFPSAGIAIAAAVGVAALIAFASCLQAALGAS